MCSRLELFDPKEECLPIKLLDELQNWKSSNSKKYFTHPLQKRKCVKDCPKTLVCHDMKGGYLEDRLVFGGKSENNYYFVHWSMVDIFVYFSHNLVTIPPCSWISSAHRNGVKVLGTFITEWNQGEKVCGTILCDIESVHQICLQLVNIANFYEFDGWLINIENKIHPNQVVLLEEFVKFLTLKMHETRQDSLVIWYDSVIQSGELKWQNELNEHNRSFFHACDGIFLNYNWNQESLKKSVHEAGSRKVDIYVGVDVFGRGCLGGGGFSTDIAVTIARHFNLSVAIFAPGWVLENCGPENFAENQYKFWNSLVELCPVRDTEGLPYYTSFCPGFGSGWYRNGEIQCSQPWYNLSLQQPQPSYHYINNISDGSQISTCTFDAFNGGGCLELKAKMSKGCNVVDFQILSTNFFIDTDCRISYTFKPKNKDIKVALTLSICAGNKYYCLNFPDEPNESSTFKSKVYNSQCPSCITSDDSTVFPISSKRVESDSAHLLSWIKRKYELSCHTNESYYIKSVGVQLSCKEPTNSDSIYVLLGELMISPRSSKIRFTYKDLKMIPNKNDYVTLECYLEWSCDDKIDHSDLYVLIADTKRYVCTTSQFCFTFRGSVQRLPEVEFILCPRQLQKDIKPVFLKVPLDLDGYPVNHSSIY